MKSIKKFKKSLKGFSLLEAMVVLTVFSLLAIVATQSILSTLRLTNKSNSSTKVRGDIDYAMSIIERHLHSATEVSPCPLSDDKTIAYKDQLGEVATFSCVSSNEEGYIASGSARITSEIISITQCSFTCVQGSGSAPPYVTVSLTARDSTKTGIESSNISTSTQIYLRTY